MPAAQKSESHQAAAIQLARTPADHWFLQEVREGYAVERRLCSWRRLCSRRRLCRCRTSGCCQRKIIAPAAGASSLAGSALHRQCNLEACSAISIALKHNELDPCRSPLRSSPGIYDSQSLEAGETRKIATICTCGCFLPIRYSTLCCLNTLPNS